MLPLFSSILTGVLSLVMPMQAEQAFNRAYSVLEGLSSKAGSLTAHFSNIGIAIGAGFLLVVVFYYVTAILDGGKFQTKMLFPIIIFIIVSDFAIVASPLVGFTSYLQKACNEACRQDAAAQGGTEVVSSLLEQYLRSLKTKQNSPEEKPATEMRESIKEKTQAQKDGAASEGATDEEKEKWYEAAFNSMSKAISSLDFVKGLDDWVDDLKAAAIEEFDDIIDLAGIFGVSAKGTKHELGKNVLSVMDGKFVFFLIALIFEWICEIFAFVMICFGSILTYLFIVFGPIIWAFAIFPGNGKVIGSWFVRIIQYSLYSPIVAVVQAFGVEILSDMTGISGGVSNLLLILVFVLNIVLLLNVPQLASMIIEGATGSVSIAQGINTISNTVHMISENMRDTKAMNQDKEQRDTTNSLLSDIKNSLGGSSPSAPGVGSQKGAEDSKAPEGTTTVPKDSQSPEGSAS